jgi:hypothetical protein
MSSHASAPGYPLSPFRRHSRSRAVGVSIRRTHPLEELLGCLLHLASYHCYRLTLWLVGWINDCRLPHHLSFAPRFIAAAVALLLFAISMHMQVYSFATAARRFLELRRRHRFHPATSDIYQRIKECRNAWRSSRHRLLSPLFVLVPAVSAIGGVGVAFTFLSVAVLRLDGLTFSNLIVLLMAAGVGFCIATLIAQLGAPLLPLTYRAQADTSDVCMQMGTTAIAIREWLVEMDIH